MEKKYEDTLSFEQKQECLQVSQLLKTYGIDSAKELQGCTFAEFLAQQNPKKYNHEKYITNQDLQKIYTILLKEQKMAVMINLNKEGKVPYGDFADQNLENHQIKLAPEVQEKIKNTIEKMSNGVLSIEEQEKIAEKILPENLDSLEKIATMDDDIEIRVKTNIKAVVREKNQENGYDEIDEEKAQKSKNKKVVLAKENDGQDDEKDVPEDVRNACEKIGVTRIKNYFYVQAVELENKIDGTRVDKNGDKVLMLEVEDLATIGGPNKYYGMQENRMVLHGTENREVRDITGNAARMGELIEPLKVQNAKYVEYGDSEGLVVKEKIDDRDDLSVHKANNYKEDMEKLLEKYAQNVYMIKYDSNLSPEQKMKELEKIDFWCDKETEKIALENGVSVQDHENINSTKDEHLEDIKEEIEDDEPDAFEVPGKRRREW